MCRFFGVSKSCYYAFAHRLSSPEKDAVLAEIFAEDQERSFRTYGYRRILLIPEKGGIHRDPKTVLRITKKYDLFSEIRRLRKWQQMGQQVHKHENLLSKDFHADKPNSKWVTGISYLLFPGYSLQEEPHHFSTVSYNFRHRFTGDTMGQVFTRYRYPRPPGAAPPI